MFSKKFLKVNLNNPFVNLVNSFNLNHLLSKKCGQGQQIKLLIFIFYSSASLHPDKINSF